MNTIKFTQLLGCILSSLLTICVYFKFSRLWSVRNLDLVGLILLAPGLLMVASGAVVGYLWLFFMGGMFLVRLLLDPTMVRRPLLEPNLSVGGMTFLGSSLFLFLMANVLNSRPTSQELAEVELADRRWAGPALDQNNTATKPGAGPAASGEIVPRGPGYALLYSLPNITTQSIAAPPDTPREDRNVRGDVVRTAGSRVVVILSHLAIIIGMVLIGFRHFDNVRTGIAAATLYLLVPYTAQYMGHPDHVLPAALVIWAIQCYRRPLVAGLLLGLATVVMYPIFLVPLWLGFYWPRGFWRFGLGVSLAVGAFVLSLAFMPQPFWPLAEQFFGLAGVPPTGFWASEHVNTVYRIPVLAAFVALCGSLTLWPAQKNLGTLMSCSAAVMVAAQFWMPTGGGLHIAWYLPLLLLTIFRPNLEDRVALNALSPRWLGSLARMERAA